MTNKIYKTIEEAEEFCRKNFSWDESEVVLGHYWVAKGFIIPTEGGYLIVNQTE